MSPASPAPAPADVRRWASRVTLAVAGLIAVAGFVAVSSVDPEESEYASLAAGIVLFFVVLPTAVVSALVAWVIRRVAIPPVGFLLAAALLATVAAAVPNVAESEPRVAVFLVVFDGLVAVGIVVWGVAYGFASAELGSRGTTGTVAAGPAPPPAEGEPAQGETASAAPTAPIPFVVAVAAFVLFMASFAQGAGEHETGPPLLWASVAASVLAVGLAVRGLLRHYRDPGRGAPWLAWVAIAVAVLSAIFAVPYLP